MGKWEKLLTSILRGASDGNVGFGELRTLLLKMGFRERIKGSHHIFHKDGVEEIINIQSKKGKAKPYQVKQVRRMIVKHQLTIGNNEE